MYGLIHELLEVVVLASAVMLAWATPRPAWVSKLYTKLGIIKTQKNK